MRKEPATRGRTSPATLRGNNSIGGSTAKATLMAGRHSERSEESRQRGEGTSLSTVAESPGVAQGFTGGVWPLR